MMKPLRELRDPGRIRGLLFDIDETLTTEGKLTAEAYAAIESLKRAGRIVVPVTGRPAGWCDHIARMWPVDAVVGENGAFYFCFSHGKLHRKFRDAERVRAANRKRLAAIGARILKQVRGCALASDQPYRETDLAIDYCEDVQPLPPQAAERIAELMRAEGLSAKISSIHVNGWFGAYDKLATTTLLFADRFSVAPDLLRQEFAFAGDSPNDAPMFAYFEHSVGVANVARFAGRLDAQPRYVTRGAAGAGFAELARHLLDARARGH
ncbi:MAG: HAD-IIB family hydrolase [Candidatus Binataceae bacterium]